MCGDTNDDGRITAGDALYSLRSAVGSAECINEICDYNGDGRITATDSLFILRTAVGQNVAPQCPTGDSALVFVTSTLSVTTTTLGGER
ncbi:MAG: dockerin type I domain-containing protein [Candidatus Binatia bacterium]